MTDSNRPPAFKIPSVKTEPLFLFFGKGDYVIARNANEASCLWMDHFDDLCYAREFVQLADEEQVEIYLDADDTACSIDILSLAQVISHREEFGRAVIPEAWTARELTERFGLGYLASTEE